jgi:hypothetical protein
MLDNDSKTDLDPSLEQLDDAEEETKFAAVAEEISSFVRRQSVIRRNHPRDRNLLPEEELIRTDLPKTFPDGSVIPEPIAERYATRDVHRKTHGCYAATLEVNAQIKEDLNRQIGGFIQLRRMEGADLNLGQIPQPVDTAGLGVFQPGATYDAIVRYSNGHPGNRHDREPDARGMAVKILPKGALTAPVSSMNPGELNRATILDILSTFRLSS